MASAECYINLASCFLLKLFSATEKKKKSDYVFISCNLNFISHNSTLYGHTEAQVAIG